ncbi:hypothetical protein ACHAWC_004236 [Mediolabrus comicus]
MPSGTCSNCCREASTLLRCKGKCGGDAMYCNKSCQKADWKMHKKICPVGGKSAQKLTFEISHPTGHPFADFPDAPVQAVRRMDGYGGSGMTLLFSDHLGIEPLLPYADELLACDNEQDKREKAIWMGEGNFPYEAHVTTPVDPNVMKLKPEEACFNTEKYGDAVNALLQHGIIEDTGKKIQIGYYPVKFPICRIHAPQTNNIEEMRRQQKEREEMFASMGFQTLHLGGGGARK